MFFFFSAQGGGRGSLRLREGAGGSVFYLKSQEGGGGGSPAQEGPRGREGVCGELGNFFGGGGLNLFFSGPKCPPSAYASTIWTFWTPMFYLSVSGPNWENPTQKTLRFKGTCPSLKRTLL